MLMSVAGEHCELEERDGHHVLQCAWERVKRVLTDYDFTLMPPKEQVLPLHCAVLCFSAYIVLCAKNWLLVSDYIVC